MCLEIYQLGIFLKKKLPESSPVDWGMDQNKKLRVKKVVT